MMAAGLLPTFRVSSRLGDRLVRAPVTAVVILGVLFNAVAGVVSLIAPGTFLAAVGQATAVLTPSASVFAEYAGARELAIAVSLTACAVWRIAPVLAGVLL